MGSAGADEEFYPIHQGIKHRCVAKWSTFRYSHLIEIFFSFLTVFILSQSDTY